MSCPYPPSDPFCTQGPTTTTTLQHVIVDNEGFAGNLQTSVDAGPTTVEAIQHQTHIMVVGFVTLWILLAIIGVWAIAAIASLKSEQR